jgi:hypothetical protein
MGAGERGRNVRELKARVTLDRLAKGGFVVARPIVSSRSNIASRSGAKARRVNAPRRFPPPWTFEDHNSACFIVKDANGLAVRTPGRTGHSA